MRGLKLTAVRIEISLRYLFILLSIIAGVQYYLQENMVRVVSSLLTIFLFMLPTLVQKLMRFTLPATYRIVFLVFIIAAMYLGELHNFFYRFAWWDDWIHTASAMLITYIGLLLFYVLSRDKDIHLKISPLLLAMFCFCFTMAFGAIWELFEFSVDKLLGLNLQKGRATTDMTSYFDGARALFNTMQDLAVSAFGALIVATLSYYSFHRRGKEDSSFLQLIKQFIQENPSLFEPKVKK